MKVSGIKTAMLKWKHTNIRLTYTPNPAVWLNAFCTQYLVALNCCVCSILVFLDHDKMSLKPWVKTATSKWQYQNVMNPQVFIERIPVTFFLGITQILQTHSSSWHLHIENNFKSTSRPQLASGDTRSPLRKPSMPVWVVTALKNTKRAWTGEYYKI